MEDSQVLLPGDGDDSLYEHDILKKYFGPVDDIIGAIHREVYGNAEDAPAYQKGFKDGYQLIDDIQSATRAIESQFEYYVTILNERLENIRKFEMVQAKMHIEKLQRELDRLINDLDPGRADSVIALARAKIRQVEADIRSLVKRLDTGQFMDDHQRAWTDYLDKEFHLIETSFQEGMQLQANLKLEMEGMRRVLADHLRAPDTRLTVEKIKELKAVLQQFPVIESAFNQDPDENRSTFWWSRLSNADNLSYYEGYAELLQEISDKLEKIRTKILDSQPFIDSPWHTRLYFFLAFFIFFGEFYLVYNFLADLLNFNIGRGIGLSSDQVFAILFSMAYPLGVGMLFKAAIAYAKNKTTFKRRLFSSVGLVLIAFSILMISIPNGINVLSKSLQGDARETLQNLFGGPEIIAVQAIAMIGFLATLTLLFALVGANLLQEAIYMSKQRYHLTGKLMKSLKKNGFYQYLEGQLQQEKAKIEALKQEKSRLEQELSKQEGRYRFHEAPMGLINTKASIKETVVHRYRHGFEVGRSQRLMKIKEDQYLIYRMKTTNHNQKFN
ncbi:hypothetical protein CRP01_33445 [Flavilitoribacter nigricans DSM 23189 = NBRC 102662]|uniref:Uncharacterized protein n=1 Tax=Flavilitoribacter nigricans (strain ATCC 23147 / DSM 23189 / NBRC 102662 / NCIMB 1420 / SS-2) TaxID=1122177 RepID=A0A2D0N134_FLAN2|nr:hypothetical protein CRP01_33445 [Flavilitoribacter nigricans DSM 23189 = NBRC 102662]